MPSLLVPRSAVERNRKRSLVDVTLDPAQEAAIALPRERPLLVLGEAGHGKTTVLLHRVARVGRAAPRSAVIVPTEGLVRLLQPALRRLGVDVAVTTFDRFAAQQARRSFRRLPRESEETPPAVMRLKRSAALREAIAVVAAREGDVSRRDLLHLFGDRVLMDRLGLPAHVVEAALEWTHVQFTRRTEREWAHVTDRTRLVALDGRALDEGTATAHAATIDVEDYAVLFELDRLRSPRPRVPRAFDLIAIDEAQELAPLELALLGRSLAPGGTLVVAGDADQHTDETGDFPGWDAAMRELGAPDHARTTLAIGFRCPPAVVRAARAVRDGTAGGGTSVASFRDDAALAATLGGEMKGILEGDPGASIAVVCRRATTARRLWSLLKGHVPARLVFDGRFLPRGPVQVCVVADVKGLEVDWVVVPDASASEWPADAPSRRALYVALTRARHQAVLACVGEPTAIVG